MVLKIKARQLPGFFEKKFSQNGKIFSSKIENFSLL